MQRTMRAISYTLEKYGFLKMLEYLGKTGIVTMSLTTNRHIQTECCLKKTLKGMFVTCLNTSKRKF